MGLLSAIRPPAVANKEEPMELMRNVAQVLPGMMFRVVLPNGHKA
jgi:translation initiation factor IF-1